MPSDNPKVSGRVTNEAKVAWRDFSRQHAVSISALMQALGEWFATQPERLTPPLRDVVEAARGVDVDRRARDTD